MVWYSQKLYDEMPSMVEAVLKVKSVSTMYCFVENDGVKAENDKVMF